MFRISTSKNNLPIISHKFYLELNILFNCVKKFPKTVRRPVKFLIFMHYICVFNVYLMLGETYFDSLQL